MISVPKDWLETYFEVVDSIGSALNADDLPEGLKAYEKYGRSVLYELAIEWTNEFEVLHKTREWDDEWLAEVWEFVDNKLKGE